MTREFQSSANSLLMESQLPRSFGVGEFRVQPLFMLLNLIQKRPSCFGKPTAFLKLAFQSPQVLGKRLDLSGHSLSPKHRSFYSVRKLLHAESLLPS
jgi:hypothetical protein